MTPVEARLDTHEQVCEFRYDSINARLKRIEQILIGSCAAIIGMLLTLVLKLQEREIEPITLALAAIAGIKQGVSLYKEAKAAGTDLYKITKEISGFIGQFFDSHEEIKKEVKRQELDPPKTKSMKAQALENVFHQIELERQSVEMREFLIYHTDPALGAVWSRFEEEYKKLNEENELQIEIERQAELLKKWQRKKRLSNLEDKALIIAAVLTVTIYLHLMLWSIKQMSMDKQFF